MSSRSWLDFPWHRWAMVITIFVVAGVATFTGVKPPIAEHLSDKALSPQSPASTDPWAFAPTVLDHESWQRAAELKVATLIVNEGILPALRGAHSFISIPSIQGEVAKILKDLDGQHLQIATTSERSQATKLGHGHINILPPMMTINVAAITDIIRELNTMRH